MTAHHPQTPAAAVPSQASPAAAGSTHASPRDRAVVLVGMPEDGLSLEMFQPACPAHEPPWFGPITFDVNTAKLNARVHNSDAHREATG